jgi:hypothetical protein
MTETNQLITITKIGRIGDLKVEPDPLLVSEEGFLYKHYSAFPPPPYRMINQLSSIPAGMGRSSAGWSQRRLSHSVTKEKIHREKFISTRIEPQIARFTTAIQKLS